MPLDPIFFAVTFSPSSHFVFERCPGETEFLTSPLFTAGERNNGKKGIKYQHGKDRNDEIEAKLEKKREEEKKENKKNIQSKEGNRRNSDGGDKNKDKVVKGHKGKEQPGTKRPERILNENDEGNKAKAKDSNEETAKVPIVMPPFIDPAKKCKLI